jgi:hypothetical protein
MSLSYQAVARVGGGHLRAGNENIMQDGDATCKCLSEGPIRLGISEPIGKLLFWLTQRAVVLERFIMRPLCPY